MGNRRKVYGLMSLGRATRTRISDILRDSEGRINGASDGVEKDCSLPPD